ncbi:hypothetical protein LTR91_009067 [Friedmanniomyces endolithicus]|uniref:Uncharacterized protein n=1 Tax=Friedmanniomyces endolithicus TaxID=329885 RepID=A0AAN6G2N2_9PEZI|nr:hypothetical protein LTR35_006828 [Friedmanniomyces endolithicus]KAK0295994.1 hypothetical protein LTS00_005279 [Friedmanniomyces endolithicus]KAK0328033.1 hypothetical protein LTR82_001552 [Friedmanniomyces endolithicus]KAK0924066.1 hypothetical protein LTR57_006169 [Friedmanniomyces endolithicus]KAK0970511.1 hypothetical protein LTS01_015749 [Friedmanniomyces endolithicus]
MNIRLTPSNNSPFFKSPVPRSPTKLARTEEPGLRLSTVIGTTTSTANAFDVDPARRKFAYTAGAAAVVCSVDGELKHQQRFFRARPTLAGAGRDVNGQTLGTPTPSEARNRAVGHVKEYSLGGSPLGASRDWSDATNGKTGTAKDRIKAVTSVSLSGNGKWLAVGETGYKPRILIFSLAEDSPDAPVFVLSEHTFGVHALRFSPDSKYLASLGTVNDGFLYVWQIDDRTGAAALHASNKCTTFINSMAWMGTSIVTVGLRFVKVWRPDEAAGTETRRADTSLSPATPRLRAENRSSDFGNSILSPRHKVLAGKNSLLGEVLDCNFVCALPISATEMVVCAESGEICFVEYTGDSPTLSHLITADWRICSAMLDGPETLHVFGVDDSSSTFVLSDLKSGSADPGHRTRRKTISPYRQLNETTGTPVAVASMDGLRVCLYSRGGVVISRDVSDPTQPSCIRLPGPADAVAGVAALDSDASRGPKIFTYSGKGIIQTWDAEGGLVAQCTVPLQGSEDLYGAANMLTAAAPFSNGLLVATGDKLGALNLVELETGSVVTQLRAHSSEIADIRAFRRAGQELLATASRDRTVQLFAWTDSKLELLQTMDEHAAAVTSLLATEDGQFLLSCSADRSVVVREAWLRDSGNSASVAYVILRTITLKSAPTSMCMGADQSTLFVASTDRSITKFNIKSGQTIFTFKCADSDGGEAVAMSKILYAPMLNGNPVIVGISSSDKSVRLYSELGALLARDWGHTEGVTGVALLASACGDDEVKAPRLVTVAADSTIFLWDTSPARTPSLPQQTLDGSDTIPTPKATVIMGPPLRKIMSYASLTRMRRQSSLEDSDPSSPTAAQTPTQASSPQRLRKKPSRMSIAPAPRLEPALRSSFAESSLRSSRRSSLRQRSPSPPSPRNAAAAAAKRTSHRSRPSLGGALRSKSSENVLKSFASPPPSTIITTTTPSAGFGSLTSATESASRTLRAYRKRLATAPPPSSATTELISSEALRELEKELKLTARVLGERSRGGTVDEGTMARLLDQASEKIVGMLDERIRERVEREVLGRSLDGLPGVEASVGSVVSEMGFEEEGADTLAGALERLGVRE